MGSAEARELREQGRLRTPRRFGQLFEDEAALGQLAREAARRREIRLLAHHDEHLGAAIGGRREGACQFGRDLVGGRSRRGNQGESEDQRVR